MIHMRSRGKRLAALAADAAAAAIAPLITRRSHEARLPASPRVLVIRCDHIGDAVMASTVLQPLRTALGASTLDMLVGPWAAPVFARHPAIDRLLTYATPWWLAARSASATDQRAAWARLPGIVRQIRSGRYDVGIDLRGDLRQIVCFLALGGMPIRVSTDRTGGRRLLTHSWPFDPSPHEVEKDFAIAGLLGAKGPPQLNVPPPAPSPAWIRTTLLETFGGLDYVALALRGSKPNRGWPPVHAATLVDALRDQCGLGSVYVGTAADAPLGNSIAGAARAPMLNLAGRTSLPELLAVLHDAAAVVAVDSGPMHLAAAVGVPVVALFGAGRPQYGPWSELADTVTLGPPCGCPDHACRFTGGPGRCMDELTPDIVLTAVRRALARRPSVSAP